MTGSRAAISTAIGTPPRPSRLLNCDKLLHSVPPLVGVDEIVRSAVTHRDSFMRENP